MKLIPLTKGQHAIVDGEDFEFLSRHKWTALQKKNTFYAYRQPASGHIYMHRLLTNCPPGLDVDHVNGNGLDNRKSNLRICTRAQNLHNARCRRTGKTSRYKGVCWNRDLRKWMSSIRHNGKLVYVGFFLDEMTAARAWDEAAIKYRGEFARLNFP